MDRQRVRAGRVTIAWVSAAPVVVLLATVGYAVDALADIAVLVAAGILVLALQGRAGQPWVPVGAAAVTWVVTGHPGTYTVLVPAACTFGALALSRVAIRGRRGGAPSWQVTARSGAALVLCAVGQCWEYSLDAVAFAVTVAAATAVGGAAATGAWSLAGTRLPGPGASIVAVPFLGAQVALLVLRSTAERSVVLAVPSALLLVAAAGVALAVLRPATWACVERACRPILRPFDAVLDHLDAGVAWAAGRVGPPLDGLLGRVFRPTWAAVALLPFPVMWSQVLDPPTQHPFAWVGLRTVQWAAVLVVAWAAWPKIQVASGAPPLQWSLGVGRWAGRVGAWSGAAAPPGERGDRKPTGAGALLATAAVAAPIALLQLWWIWRWRSAGNLDLDEARFAAGSIQFGNLFTGRDTGAFELWYGPLVPMLGGIGARLGSGDPRAAMSVQPLLAAATAVATTGLARRVMAPAAAVVAGVLVALLPATISATQMYLTSLGAAAAMTGALWAMVASDRGRGRSVWLVGLLLAAAPLSRTMTVALVPVVGLAAVLYASTSIHGLRRMLASIAVGSFVVAQHYLTWGWQAVDYVLGGLGKAEVQSPGVIERFTIRFDEVADGFGNPLLAIALLVGGAGAIAAWRTGVRPRPLRGRPSVVLATVVGGGWLVLLGGGYFGGLGFWDLPLIPLLVVCLVALACRLPAPVPQLAGGAAVAWVAYLALVGTWLLPPTAPGAERALSRYRTAVFQANNGPDPRISQPTRREEIRAASAEWWAVVETVDDRIREIDAERPGPLEALHLGGTNYLPTAHELLARQQGRQPIAFAPATGLEDAWSAALVARPGASERVLLVPIISDEATGAPGGRTPVDLRQAERDDRLALSRSLAAAAEAEGWTVDSTIALPLGDELQILRAPR